MRLKPLLTFAAKTLAGLMIIIIYLHVFIDFCVKRCSQGVSGTGQGGLQSEMGKPYSGRPILS